MDYCRIDSALGKVHNQCQNVFVLTTLLDVFQKISTLRELSVADRCSIAGSGKWCPVVL